MLKTLKWLLFYVDFPLSQIHSQSKQNNQVPKSKHKLHESHKHSIISSPVVVKSAIKPLKSIEKSELSEVKPKLQDELSCIFTKQFIDDKLKSGTLDVLVY